MSRRATALGIRTEALALLAELRASPLPALGGELTIRLRRVVEEVDRCVARAERDSAAAHDDGAPREADVARRLGVDPSTLRLHRAAVRRERAAAE